MVPRKTIVVFFVGLLLVYGLLMLPWPGLDNGYRRFLLVTAQSAFSSFGSQGSVEFRVILDENSSNDLGAILKKEGVKGIAAVAMNARKVGYIPTAVLVALVLATPIPWVRRGRALLWGLLLVHGFIGLKVFLWLLDGYTDPGNPIALYAPSPFWKTVLHETNLELTLAPAMSYIVPIFLWIAATFSRKELARLPQWAGLVSPAPAASSADDAGKTTSSPASQKPHRSRRRKK